MDPTDSGEGQEKPSEESQYLTPSSRGRKRKKNSKYCDYETDDTEVVKSVIQKSPQRSVGKRVASQKTPAKQGQSKTPEQPTTNGEKETALRIPPDSNEQTKLVTPKRRGRPRKTPLVTTSTVATAAAGDSLSGETGGGVVGNSVQQDDRTPKPKRNYVRRKPVEEVKDPPEEKDTKDPPEEPDEVESGGRRRRGAAKMALKYLHILAKDVLSHHRDEPESEPHDDKVSEKETSKKKRGRKRKRDDDEAADDEDFVPNVEDEEPDEADEEEPEDEEVSDADSDFLEQEKSWPIISSGRNHGGAHGKPHNGIEFSIIKTIMDSAKTTEKFREEHHSSWVFSEWVPSTNDWEPVPENDLHKYLPQELESAAFTVSREDLKQEETPQIKLKRFEATPAHPDRWDMLLFAGGPVWALEWCPMPDGAPASQYVALACHGSMDDLHCVNQTYSGPGLVQLWDCGKLEYNSRPDSQPSLVYGLAQDKGFVWQLKWCPAGGWELPNCVRKAPFMPRLGLLAVATSSGVVTIYSLPHPDALLPKLKHSESINERPAIYKARGVVTLKLGCIKSTRNERSGQILSMDWLPQKPHNIMAIGFYDGIVGLWDLSTKSSLLRFRESDQTLTLLPYRCILAHDHAVRALAFCPASKCLLTTGGDDRYVKTWDLRRLCDTVISQKRYLTTELCWPLESPGVLIAQESAYVPKGSMGVYYVDHYLKSFFAIPRSTTVWSISYSEWLHCVLSSDTLGEVIFSMLPEAHRISSVKKVVMRRFPAYVTMMVPYEATEDGNEGHPDGGQDARETEKSEGAKEEDNDGERLRRDSSLHLQFQTYKEAVKKYYLHFKDMDMRRLTGLGRRALWKHMQSSEVKAGVNADDMPMAAIYKARFNPNMSSHVWVASGGQVGLVRLHCARTFITPKMATLISKQQRQFQALYSAPNGSDAVQTAAEQL